MKLLDHQRLVTDESALKWSMAALRFAIFSDSVIGMMLNPNYAIMADKDAHKESFPSTYPFAFSSATYFIPMTGLIGVAIAASFTGTISDKVGRKPVILVCLVGSAVGSTAKWFCRKTFWGFCIANFCNGLLSGTLPPALAYISDVFASNEKKEEEFSSLVGFYVLGQSAGGIIAILMINEGLFAPLLVGSGIMICASCLTFRFLIEPGKLKIIGGLDKLYEDLNEIPLLSHDKVDEDDGKVDDEEEKVYDEEEKVHDEEEKIEWMVEVEEEGHVDEGKEEVIGEEDLLPSKVDYAKMTIILAGVFADTIGSKALFPLSVAPLAFERFYKDFVLKGEEPILSLYGYQWLTVFIAVLVIPSALLTPRVFQKIGLACTAVLGNTITGILTIALLYLANIEPPATWTFVLFCVVLHVGFPFAVMSQLSISPMLDRIAPIDKRGFVQGIYSTCLNIAMGVSPWVLGLLADATSTNTMLWIGAGVSIGAALINSPLMFYKAFQPKSKGENASPDSFDEITVSEEEELVWDEKAKKGDFLPAAVLNAINFKRIHEDRPILRPLVTTYEHDKKMLAQLKIQAAEDFAYLRHRSHKLLSEINNPETKELVEKLNIAYSHETQDDLGKWFAEYLNDNGYVGPGIAQTMKLMIMKAFPPLFAGGTLTHDNFEQALVNSEMVFNHYFRYEIETEEVEENASSVLDRSIRMSIYHGSKLE